MAGPGSGVLGGSKPQSRPSAFDNTRDARPRFPVGAAHLSTHLPHRPFESPSPLSDAPVPVPLPVPLTVPVPVPAPVPAPVPVPVPARSHPVPVPILAPAPAPEPGFRALPLPPQPNRIGIMKRLPIFVLPTVLFPGSLLPLHVFEPRYRQMAARCLETDRRFGVLYHDPDESGPFELREGAVGCEAEILKFEPLQDGRSLVLTAGLERFRVIDGIESETLYTEALVEYLDDAAPPLDIRELRRITLDRFESALRRAGRDRQSVPDIDEQRDVSFQIAQNFRIALSWQQRLLEIPSEVMRLQEIEHALEQA